MMMCKLFTQSKDLLMSLQPDFPVKTSAVPESKQGLGESEADCSTKSSDWLGSFNLDSSSLKTLQISCLTKTGRRSKKCSTKLPAQGLMRNGQLFQRVMWEPATYGSECGSLPTPKAGDGERGRDRARSRADTKGRELATVVRDQMLPTPVAQTGQGGPKGLDGGAGARQMLADAGFPRAVGAPTSLPTPTTRDYKDGSQQGCANTPPNGLLGREIHQAVGSPLTGEAMYLNPFFVEEMMGFPVGWTDLKR
jgi:hypothetical protein